MRDSFQVGLDRLIRIPSFELPPVPSSVPIHKLDTRRRTSGELILTERMLASTISSLSQMFSNPPISLLLVSLP